MRIGTFEIEGDFGKHRRIGALLGEQVVDLHFAYASLLIEEGLDEAEAGRMARNSVPPDMEGFVEAGKGGLDAGNKALEFAATAGSDRVTGPQGIPGIHLLEDLRLMPPLTNPNSLRDFIAFEDHARAGARRRGEELSKTWFERPFYYKGNHRQLLGPGDPLSRPDFSKELDLEMEIACIIGTRGIDLDEQGAAESIFGFTLMNDWSARDVQRQEMASRMGPSKSKDFGTSLGPWILTADEIGPQPELAMAARVNGEIICEASLGDAHWKFPRLISFVSQGETVWPTDIFGSGTPFGGCLLDRHDGKGPYLEPGDLVELEAEGIGVLSNRVGDSR